MRQKRPFTRFETLAQKLVEGSFKRLFGEQLEPYEVAARLAQAMEDATLDGLAPNLYEVTLAEADHAALLAKYPALPAQLAAYLTELAQQAEFVLVGAVEVVLTAVNSPPSHQFYVIAHHSQPADEPSTQIQLRDEAADGLGDLQALDAYLVIGGREHFALNKPIVSIGRRRDNDVVLDAPTVSRQHVQIRWRYGRFILYNLSRRGRTAVNDQSVTEHVLQPGDVIALSNIQLIYGEGETRPTPEAADEGDQTRQMPKL